MWTEKPCSGFFKFAFEMKLCEKHARMSFLAHFSVQKGEQLLNEKRHQKSVTRYWEKTTERKCAKLQDQGISRLKVKRKRKLWKWTQRNGQFYVQLCTENQCNRATLMAFYTNFATEFFHRVFTRRFILKGTLRRDQKVIFVTSPISSPIVMP